MTYQEFIQNIIKTRGQHNISEDEYYENHHIIPRCLGGRGDTKDNYFKKNSTHPNCIRLYPKEHFIAHKLLALENPKNKKLVYAWTAMWVKDPKTQKRIEPSPEEYQQMRIMAYEFIKQDSLEKWQNPEFRKKQIWTEERRRKQSLSQKGRKLSIETRTKISNKLKGRSSPKKGKKSSLETCLKISKATKGENNGMYGRTHSIEAKEKLRQANLGKEVYWWNNGIKNTMSRNCPGEGWIKGRLSGFKHKSNEAYHKKRGPTLKYKWLLPDGSVREMDKQNVQKWHKDWKLIE